MTGWEMARETAEERYRAFIENSTEGIWRFDTEQPIPTDLAPDEQIDLFYKLGYLAEANDAFARMYGFEQGDQLAGTRLGDLLERDNPTNERYLRAFIEAGYRLSDAISVETDRNGQVRHFANSLTGIVDSGHLLRAWGTQRDITAQVSAEARLRETADLLSAIAYGTADAVFVKDRDGRYRFANGAVAHAVSKPMAQIIGSFDHDFLPPDVARQIRANDLSVMASGLPLTTEEIITDRGGKKRYFLATKSPLRDNSGGVTGIIGVTRDITEMRRAERARADSEARIRALYELTSRSDLTFDEKIERLLRVGRDWLGLTIGLLARTDCDQGTYEIVQIDAEGDAFAQGHVLSLDQTFCSEIVSGRAETHPLAVAHAGSDAAWREHPSYKAFKTEAYLGAVVQVAGTAWGALAFADAAPRSTPFTDFDKDLVRLMAQWVGGEIARQEQEAALQAGAERQRRFLRDMVRSMTEGRLRVCLSHEDLPPALSRVTDAMPLTVPTLRLLRRRLCAVTDALGFGPERAQDIETAVGEAAMNAAKHGGGGEGFICADSHTGTVQVWIRDEGRGISDDALPRMLEKGVSTAGTLGHGFYLMLKTCDRVYLLTGPGGTTVVLEQDKEALEPDWLRSITM